MVERLRRGEITTERLLDNDTGITGAVALGQPLHHGAEHAGRDGEVVQRSHGTAQSLFQVLVGRGVAVIAVDIAQLLAEPGERILVNAAILLQAVARTLAQLVQGPASAGHFDDGHIQLAAPNQGLQRGKNVLVRQIAGGAEEDEGVRCGMGHVSRSGWCYRAAGCSNADGYFWPLEAAAGATARPTRTLTACSRRSSIRAMPFSSCSTPSSVVLSVTPLALAVCTTTMR